MVPLFVPEETWGPRSWGVNHPLYVRGQIEHGLDEAELRLLGLLAVQQPGRRLPRVRRRPARPRRRAATPPTRSAPTGTSPTRAARRGLARRRRRTATAWSPRTRRSSRCATRREAALANLRQASRDDFDAYGPGGFYDAVAVESGKVSQALPVARPGHGHGRARQRAGRRRHAPLRRPGRDGAEAPAADGAGGLQRRRDRHRHQRRRP